MNRPHDVSPESAARELARVGAAALPEIDELAPMHLSAIDEALRSMTIPTSSVIARRAGGRHSMWGSRRAVVALAAAAFVAIPSMAIAGVLPDDVQHAASKAAGAVGVTLPDPASDRAKEVQASHTSSTTGDSADPGSGQDRADEQRQGDTGNGRGADVRGTSPGQPEAGEQRGNRYGQVEGGPDQGKAAQAHAEHRPATKPATSQRPATPPGQGDDHGNADHASQPATSNAGGNSGDKPADPGNGNGNGKGH